MRIGYGYDSHRFMEGEFVMIGGVKIPHHKGISAHSDGDVLLHAMGDALLGAAALGDLGRHFPDTDEAYRGVCSAVLLKKIMQFLAEKNYKVVNVDATVIAEKPKLLKYIDLMRENIAKIVDLSVDDVNVKAKTNEKMGWIGREEGIAAHAIVLLSG